VVIEGGTSADRYLTGATADLTDATIESSAGYGILSGFGSVLFMHAGVIENNGAYGVSAYDNGEIDLDDGVVVQKNTQGGGYATEGVAIQLYGGSVQNNGGPGFYVQHNGNVRIDALSAPPGVVNNAGNGISSIEASTATVANGAVVSGNGLLRAGTLHRRHREPLQRRRRRIEQGRRRRCPIRQSQRRRGRDDQEQWRRWDPSRGEQRRRLRWLRQRRHRQQGLGNLLRAVAGRTVDPAGVPYPFGQRPG
jgi:hypothetical protein